MEKLAAMHSAVACAILNVITCPHNFVTSWLPTQNRTQPAGFLRGVVPCSSQTKWQSGLPIRLTLRYSRSSPRGGHVEEGVEPHEVTSKQLLSPGYEQHGQSLND